ncbi:hypothetical protein [Pedobacter zeae]|uniref:Uncharacterized protein n=1 Tax=Pedobacter zeae TaxID=1737356 RepID=A0A7W6K6X0_9SPHI|nr:hypothetical protein [Pedobacter zeae]MBB4106270.1 hypothetical protein [Pedobacter zeae]GGH00623.1 hypothetical protein GCM10007422_14000 [Pedobacter zeae]
MSYITYIQQRFESIKLYEEVAEFFNVDPSKIGNLDSNVSKDIYLNVEYFDAGFCTRLSVYFDVKNYNNLKEIDFSIFLSERLNENVLISFWTNNPFLWILIEPKGSLFKVQEIPGDEGVVIDFTSKELLSLELVKRESLD